MFFRLWSNLECSYCRSAKTADKCTLNFTDEDDPFGNIKGGAKADGQDHFGACQRIDRYSLSTNVRGVNLTMLSTGGTPGAKIYLVYMLVVSVPVIPVVTYRVN